MGTTTVCTSLSVSEFVREYYRKFNVCIVSMRVVGSTAYVAVKVDIHGETQTLCDVWKTSKKGKELSYKIIDETCGPFFFECPLSILAALSEPINDYSREWRERCRNQKEKERQIKELKPGTILRNGYEYLGVSKRAKKFRYLVTKPSGETVRTSKETILGNL